MKISEHLRTQTSLESLTGWRAKDAAILILTIVLGLTWASNSQAAGFNVNALLGFVPNIPTLTVVSDTTGCPTGFTGKLTFTAQLSNKPDSPALPGLDVYVRTLTHDNLLLDPRTSMLLGGMGALIPIPLVGEYADGVLSPNEAVDVPFVVCLKTQQSFTFLVDVFGVVTELVSVNRAGTDSGLTPIPFGSNMYRGSFNPVISGNGRFVAFVSSATDLVGTSTGGGGDLFVRDLETKMTTLITVNRTGTSSSDATMFLPSINRALLRISASGRVVAFASNATDLVAMDLDRKRNLFARDLQTGTTTLVNVNHTGTDRDNGGFGEFDSLNFDINADGRFVLFQSAASDLVAADSNGSFDIFVRDLQAESTTLVSVNRTGTDSGNGGSIDHVMSADGRIVAFRSNASDLVANDTNDSPDVFVRDLQTGTTALVSVNHLGTDSGHGSSSSPVISADGRFVAFRSSASDLVANDTDGVIDVFVRDLQTGMTILVASDDPDNNTNIANYMLSADGRFMAFLSNASNLVANDTNGTSDVFVRDLQTGTTSLVSVNRTGSDSGNGGSFDQMMSADGRFVAFQSSARDLVTNDPDNRPRLFVRDLQTGTTTAIDVNRSGTGPGNDRLGFPLLDISDASVYRTYVLSADGRFVAFGSFASDLIATDTNMTVDVFVRPVR